MAYADEVLADSPAAYWRLGEASGTSHFDETANNNDGTSVNTPTLGQSGAISGDSNTAIRFTRASSQRIEVVELSASLDLGDTFTLEAWVKLASTGQGTFRSIVSKQTSTYYLRITDTDAIQLLKSQTAAIVTSTVALPDTSWHHVVATKTGATVKLYIDSVDRTGTVTDATCTNTNATLFIGAETGPGEHSNETLDEVAIYPTVLDAARVLAHYQSGAPKVPTFLPFQSSGAVRW